MEPMTELKIKNMVCDRCIASVREVLQGLEYEVTAVELGEATVAELPSNVDREKIAEALREKGFELISSNEEALVEDVRAQLIMYLEKLEEGHDPPKVSTYLSEQLHHNYSYLSNKFSSETKTTIEQYLIQLKIERVKELLSYDELTLSEIAWKLNYSSVQYLSNQFKKVTGETVSSFRKHMDEQLRQSLDSIR
jgi:AraC-like DNA-binding protein